MATKKKTTTAAQRTIEVYGRRWFSTNTYHSVQVIDGDWVKVIPFSYGYGDHYLETAHEALIAAGRLPAAERYTSGGKESLSRHCRDHGIELITTIADVPRKKDLHNAGRE